MNPDKLFDYLDGRLPAAERAALEERLISDKQLQREFAVARQIHAGIRGDSREVILPQPPDSSEQGHKMAIRIGAAFMVLMFVNVGIGLWFIFKHESSNPNRTLLEAQMRKQIAESINRAATLTPAPNALGVSEIAIRVENGRLDAVANEVVAVVSRFGGSSTKGIPDRGRVSVLADVPASQEPDFRNAIASIQNRGSLAQATMASPLQSESPTTATNEKKSFVVQIIEAEPK
jgi:hypothetical protein